MDGFRLAVSGLSGYVRDTMATSRTRDQAVITIHTESSELLATA